MPQLVGQTCALCGKGIKSIVEGEYCQSCNKPVHSRCKVAPHSSASEQCNSCGINRTDQEIVQRNKAKSEAVEVIQNHEDWPKLSDVGLSQPVAQEMAERYSSEIESTKTWPVKLETFLGGFQIHGRWAVRLAEPASLSVTGDGRIQLFAHYDPPGSGWLSLMATVASAFAAMAVHTLVGFAVAPGWLIWYFILVTVRKQRLRISLNQSESIVTDPETQRLAFRVVFKGRPRWIAFHVPKSFPELAGRIAALDPTKIKTESIARPAVVAPIMIGIVILIAVIVGMIYVAVKQ